MFGFSTANTGLGRNESKTYSKMKEAGRSEIPIRDRWGRCTKEMAAVTKLEASDNAKANGSEEITPVCWISKAQSKVTSAIAAEKAMFSASH